MNTYGYDDKFYSIPEINHITLSVNVKNPTRLEVLESYLAEARLKPEENELYIHDLSVSIEHERKYPTKNYTQECFGWIIPQGLGKRR